jgi:RNA polymerase sigma factor (sigma-70 family)
MSGDETTFHVRRACSGDSSSLEWIYRRFTPALLATAEYRLRGRLRQRVDPEEVIGDVWTRVIPRLGDLEPRDGRLTPVLLRFCSTVLQLRVRELFKKHIAGKPHEFPLEGRDPGTDRQAPLLTDPSPDAAARAAHGEEIDALRRALEKLDERSRELVVLRGFEQLSYREIEAIVGRPAKNLTTEFQRALDKLRELLPKSLFDELEDDRAAG